MTWTDCDEAEGYVVPNVLSPRDLVFRPDFLDETVTSSSNLIISLDTEVSTPLQLSNTPQNPIIDLIGY